MTEPAGGDGRVGLPELAAANPRVLGLLRLEHGQVAARVAYEQRIGGPGSPALVEETIILGPGLGSDPQSPAGMAPALLRELARHAVQEALRQGWELRLPDGRALRLGETPLLMGVLNVTRDSFSDGGLYLDPGRAVARGLEMMEEGADLIDVGGESTRPGAVPVPLEEELDRVLPVVERLSREPGAVISIDTCKAEVARQALAAGAALVNDVTALQGDEAMGSTVAAGRAPVVLMHMRGSPSTMQIDPSYQDVTREVSASLRQALVRALEAGIPVEQTVVDPGLGFGKTADHNLTLLQRLAELRSLGRPILIGASRKSFLGHLLGLEVGDRAWASALVHAIAVLRGGAAIIRAHDVAITRQALDLAAVLRTGSEESPL